VRAVTPDSNLYISALIWGGKPQQLLEIALARKVRLFISGAIIDEVLEVLETKFNHSPKRLALEKEYIGKCTNDAAGGLSGTALDSNQHGSIMAGRPRWPKTQDGKAASQRAISGCFAASS
jgi:hypothetical protein